jgi:hypothetical protein
VVADVTSRNEIPKTIIASVFKRQYVIVVNPQHNLSSLVPNQRPEPTPAIKTAIMLPSENLCPLRSVRAPFDIFRFNNSLRSCNNAVIGLIATLSDIVDYQRRSLAVLTKRAEHSYIAVERKSRHCSNSILVQRLECRYYGSNGILTA